MAKSTTYKNKPKPFAQKGFFNESNRHALSSKGIKSGTNQVKVILPKEPEPLIDLGTGIKADSSFEFTTKVEPEEQKEPEPIEFTYETQVEAEPIIADEIEIEGDEIEIKKPRGNIISDIVGGFKEQKRLKSKKLKKKAYETLDKKYQDDDLLETDFAGRGKFGKILADLFGDYNSQDLADLSMKELETLAVRLEGGGGGLFGKPYNPFKEELKKRIIAHEKLKIEKQKLQAELEPLRQNIKQEIAQMKQKQVQGSGMVADIKEFWGLK